MINKRMPNAAEAVADTSAGVGRIQEFAEPRSDCPLAGGPASAI